MFDSLSQSVALNGERRGKYDFLQWRKVLTVDLWQIWNRGWLSRNKWKGNKYHSGSWALLMGTGVSTGGLDKFSVLGKADRWFSSGDIKHLRSSCPTHCQVSGSLVWQQTGGWKRISKIPVSKIILVHVWFENNALMKTKLNKCCIYLQVVSTVCIQGSKGLSWFVINKGRGLTMFCFWRRVTFARGQYIIPDPTA